MTVQSPRVFTVPASVPFLPTLVTALVQGKLVPGFSAPADPLVLAATTLYLPTRRACRLVRDVFLDVLQTGAAVLPHIVAIGDIDEDEIVFADAATGASADLALELPPALGGLERRMLLAQLVLKWSTQLVPRGKGETPLVVNSPASALALADDLARLMDDMSTRAVPWEKLEGLVPDHVDEYWQLTLGFLKIAGELWPRILDERSAIEPAVRRDRMILAEAARLTAAASGPVVAAGSTGSMPATAKLLATIATLPHGAVVLPGLDSELDADAWATIAGDDEADRIDLRTPTIGHPQFAMHALLATLDLDRKQVVVLGDPTAHGRELLISEALRPAAATEHWQERLKDPTFATNLEKSLSGLALIEAANSEEEALAIAVALRETLERPHATAALVTPDRTLGRRVGAALGRWNIVVDDSGGDPLADTTPGQFARLAADVALGGLAPIALLALLKHRLIRLDGAPGAHARAMIALERAILRGPRPRAGSRGLSHALTIFRSELAKLRRGESSDLHPSDPRSGVADDDLAAAADLIGALARELAPLEQLDPSKPYSFRAIAARHREVVAALSRDDTGDSVAFSGVDGAALGLAFEDIAEQPAPADLVVPPADYGELFLTAIADRVVRRSGAVGSRVGIYGPLEARLMSFDRIVVGGLVEGVWPPDTRTDPWLSRPMRHQLGLDLPERRIGLSAHDFAQLLGTPEVILTRSAKMAGAPTVASRFLQRMAAIAGPAHWQTVIAKGNHYVDLARALDLEQRARPIKRPEPRPPRLARPQALSVTEIEHWLRDPYTIYAKHILKLVRLDVIDTPPGAADRGSAIHGAVGEFTQAYAHELPENPLAELLRIGRVHFVPLDDFPEARAFWWPRFERIARWLTAWESERRTNVTTIHAEIRGEIAIPLDTRNFRLSARADRIERRADGRYAILDFKTGEVPSDKQVRIGVAPQLTLEAAILRNGGFQNIDPGALLAELLYVQLKGGDPAGKAAPIEFNDVALDDAADHALMRLKGLITRFENESTPYRSLLLPMWKNRYGTYDDLARVKEWSQTAGAEDGAEE
jgi:ATP-dependent helicase/nuclease subunit B